MSKLQKPNDFYVLKTPAEYQQLSIALSFARSKLTDQIKEVKVGDYKRIKSSITEQMIKREALRQLSEMDSYIQKGVLLNLFNKELELQAEADAQAGEINAPIQGGVEGMAQIQEEGVGGEGKDADEEEEEEEPLDDKLLFLMELEDMSEDELAGEYDEYFDRLADMGLQELGMERTIYMGLMDYIERNVIEVSEKVESYLVDLLEAIDNAVEDRRATNIPKGVVEVKGKKQVAEQVASDVAGMEAEKQGTKKIKFKSKGNGFFGAYTKPLKKYSIKKLGLMEASALAGNNNKQLLKLI
jgi:hypothetical protein